MKKNKWTGERLETTVKGRIAIEHLHRYAIALDYVENKIVLDIACGEGYGANLVSKRAKFVYGVDIDKYAITHAIKKYTNANLKFLEGNTSKIPLKESSVDIVISFETIEHHNEHNEMMLEIKRVLKPNGVLVISSPDKLFYSDYRNYKNEFHKKELYKDEFNNLIIKYFKEVQLLSQTHLNGLSLILDEKNQDELNLFSGDFNETNNKDKEPMFLLAIASDVLLKKQVLSIFDGVEVNQSHISNEVDKIKNTITFKIGRFMLSPFRFLKSYIK